MVITYQGGRSFKISQGELSLVINPQSKTSADITIVTDEKKEISDKSGFVISGPGEYEIKEVFVKGFAGQVYLITFEGIKTCFLGSETSEELDDVDILLTPVALYKNAVSLESAVMIPMDFDKTSLSQFLKEAGETKVEPIDKLVVKKKDLEGKEGEVVVLQELT
ncbi:MAG TPA: hypothetical protein VJJ48_00380 [Candidatus Paceibacterota bacterium]